MKTRMKCRIFSFFYDIKDPDHKEKLGETAFEDIFHYNFFSTDTDFSSEETDVEEIDFSFDVRECHSFYINQMIIYFYLVHFTASRSTTNANLSDQKKLSGRETKDNQGKIIEQNLFTLEETSF